MSGAKEQLLIDSITNTTINGIPIPPAPVPQLNTSKQSTTPFRKPVELNQCKWASNYPEIQIACYFAQVCLNLPPKLCCLKYIEPILQEGPTCGLVALSMLFGGTPNANDLLNDARDNKYTINGEMFSAEQLYCLAQQTISTKKSISNQNIKLSLFNGNINCDKIKQILLNGGCLLVPYDPDFNHGPCLRKGHKAHWSLIIGYLVDCNDRFYVFSRHGKTKNIGVWSLKALSASNANLREFEQPKGYPDVDFLLPDGGLGGDLGLNCKSIIAENLSIDNVLCI